MYICVWCLGFSGIDLHGDFCAQNQALLLHCCSSFGLYLAVCPIPSSILQPGKSRRLGFLHPRQVWLSLYPPPLREQKQIRTVAAASFRSVQPNRPDTGKGKNLCWKKKCKIAAGEEEGNNLFLRSFLTYGGLGQDFLTRLPILWLCENCWTDGELMSSRH